MNNEQLLAWIKKNPIIVGCASLSLVLGILLYFTSDSVPDARNRLEDLSGQEQKLQANNEYSAKLPEQYKELVAANEAIAARMVKPNQLALNLQYFYKLESDTNTKIVEIHQGQSGYGRGPKPIYAPVSFGLSVDGDWASVIDVLHRLENSPHYCRINSCSIMGNQQSNLLHLTLDLQMEGVP